MTIRHQRKKEKPQISKHSDRSDLTKETRDDTKDCVVLDQSIASILHAKTAFEQPEEPFYVADLGEVERQYWKWKKLMPRVRPFYGIFRLKSAVKCNPDLQVLRTLARLGAGFDCASKQEISLAMQTGVSHSDIIYANPCKQGSHIRYAASYGVNTMTFDNEDELLKIKAINPDAKLVLRLLTDDSKSLCRFGVKFGASLAVIPSLMLAARKLKLNIIGVSFHVGSGCFDASAFTDAVKVARQAFDIGISYGFHFTLLDIGGGFPGNNPTGLQFTDVAAVLAPTIDALFPDDIKVIAEPGRYFVSSAYTLAVNVMARRVTTRDLGKDSPSSMDDHPSYMYYINDGMYGSFNCITFDHAVCNAEPLVRAGHFCYDQEINEELFSSTIWGPTCDSIDLIGKDVSLPEMRIGDWLVFRRMGAYTMAAASNFNGFAKSAIVYTNTNVSIEFWRE